MYERLKERLRIISKAIKTRERIQLDINTFEHWNRTHPDEEPLDVSDFQQFADGLDVMLKDEESRPIAPSGYAIAPTAPRIH